jgi:hypothetical protein
MISVEAVEADTDLRPMLMGVDVAPTCSMPPNDPRRLSACLYVGVAQQPLVPFQIPG